jgi:subtilisin family serine protease
MNNNRSIKQLLILTLATFLCLSQVSADIRSQTRTLGERRAVEKGDTKLKIAPDLAELLAQDEQAAKEQKNPTATLAGARERKLSARRIVNHVVIPSTEVAADEQQNFIVRMDDLASSAAMQAKLAAFGGRVSRRLDGMGLVVVEAPRTAIRQLAADSQIAYISPDRLVQPTGFVEETTGTTLVRTILGGSASLDGKGIGIAILDSGIYNKHNAYLDSNKNNIVFSKDFTGENNTSDDFYGHGSHVATLASGSQSFASNAYRGIANKASVLNLRVLNSLGFGSASTIIAALDWCVASKATYNIRVINLSLGTDAKDSYKNDPLCLAARRAYNAGIVVVAAAGNSGRDLYGNKIYGGIHSPGIEPSVITVGAANSMGTLKRSDDVVTTFSSRGPTRGYTVVNGQRVYDNLIKPDLVAPGNKLISAQSAGQTASSGNTLVQLFPALDTEATNTRDNKTMYLSGTSMSAPVVAGAAALLLELNPNLTPGLVKAILMYTAQPIKNFNTLEQGAGLLNVDGAARMAKIIKSTASTLNNGATMIATKNLPTQTSMIAGETCYWGKGVITDHCFLYGDGLMQYWQGMYGQGVVLADATSVVSGRLTKNSSLTTNTVSISGGAVKTTGVVLSDGVVVSDGVVLSDGVVFADGAVLSDGVVVSDGVILSDGIFQADGIVKANLWITGDPTASMKPIPLP